MIETGKIVKILPTKVWIENNFTGSRFVVVQHEGCKPFDYAVFNYDYKYTSNAGIDAQAEKLAIDLGAIEPVEYRERKWIL